jgi:RNA polymerase sigma factor (TIGR02999 family)
MKQKSDDDSELTVLLAAWNRGDPEALERLTPMVYRELYRVAKRQMASERQGHTLGATALVNEVYIRLIDRGKVQWRDRAHFRGICARLMRQILVDFARARLRDKRGGGQIVAQLDEETVASDTKSAEVVAVHEALDQLQAVHPRKSQVVELRYFGGFSVEETAEVLDVSPFTVIRDWNLAKAWLHREISGQSHDA